MIFNLKRFIPKTFLENKTPEYRKLLTKYATDIDIFELIERCILDEFSERESEYLKNNKYPEKRELLMKLKSDLILARNEIQQKGGKR